MTCPKLSNSEPEVQADEPKCMQSASMILPDWWLEAAKRQRIVLMAGAGVSGAVPSSLPGWYGINSMIVSALSERIDAYIGKPSYTAKVRAAIDARRNDNGFPPDYQAQILEENCGADYFRALQSLDVDACNSAHEAIAWLAKHGVLAAIVTTNFDRLIEHALKAQRVRFQVAYEPKSYARCLQALDGTGPLQVLKVHGCVRDHRSLVDTLKQRLLGRNNDLEACLTKLLAAHPWAFLGFSAADLETDDNYLRLIPGAASSPGIVYVRWPGSPALSNGAKKLKEAYKTRFAEATAESADFLAALQVPLGITDTPVAKAKQVVDTRTLVSTSLDKWAKALHPAAAVNCLATLAEAAGQAEAAFQLLHRFWKDVGPDDRSGPDFERYRFHHGRLGIGGGLLSTVDDLGTTAGMESLQNLLRVTKGGDARASAWAGAAWVWAGDRDKALSLVAEAQKVFDPSVAKEIQVDVWLASTEVAFGLCEPEGSLQTVASAARIARESGDLPREAKVWALGALVCAEFSAHEYPDYMRELAGPVLDRAQRLNDPVIEGFAALAQGRYLTKQRDSTGAMEALDRALVRLIEAARPPWRIFAAIEKAKALYDLGGKEAVDRAGDQLQEVDNVVDRWQLWLPWVKEAYVQAYLMFGEIEPARKALEEAIQFAEAFGLSRKVESLQRYFEHIPNSIEPGRP